MKEYLCKKCEKKIDINDYNTFNGFCEKCYNKWINKKEYRNETKKQFTFFLVILLFFIILCIIFIGSLIFNRKIDKEQEILNNIKIDNEQNEQEVLDYLNTKYNRIFNVELISDGYKPKYISLDGSAVNCGHDENTKQYIYKTSTDIPVSSYIKLFINVNTGEKSISEQNERGENTSFELNYNLYKAKMNIKKDLDNYFKSSKLDYSIDYYNVNNLITINIKESVRKEVTLNYQNVLFVKQLYIKNTLDKVDTGSGQNRRIDVKIMYDDYEVNIISSKSASDKLINGVKFADSVIEYINNNFSEICTYKGGCYMEVDASFPYVELIIKDSMAIFSEEQYKNLIKDIANFNYSLGTSESGDIKIESKFTSWNIGYSMAWGSIYENENKTITIKNMTYMTDEDKWMER